MHMQIELRISTDTLGQNSVHDNQRYYDAVVAALSEHYPDADIDVSLDTDASSSTCWISDSAYYDSADVESDVRDIARIIWDKSDY